jgi:ADP-ribosylglycohydrolase
VEELAKQTAEVTHNHPEGIKGAQATAACILMARRGASNDEIRAYVEERYEYDLDFTLDDIRPLYGFDVSCQGSVPQAIVAFLESSDFEDAIRLAVSIGGDSDTIAAITGSIAQARYGIPDWIAEETEKRLTERLASVVNLFCERFM